MKSFARATQSGQRASTWSALPPSAKPWRCQHRVRAKPTGRNASKEIARRLRLSRSQSARSIQAPTNAPVACMPRSRCQMSRRSLTLPPVAPPPLLLLVARRLLPPRARRRCRQRDRMEVLVRHATELRRQRCTAPVQGTRKNALRRTASGRACSSASARRMQIPWCAPR